MATWDRLPHEILEIIIYYIGKPFETVKTMAVNKQWYNLYLSRLFKTVSLRIHCSDLKLHLILTSPFEPGQWTTCINFISVKSQSSQSDITQDLLYNLMKKTPCVQKVKFDCIERMDAQDWVYFSNILRASDIWKLQVLPDNWKLRLLYNSSAFKLVYTAYYHCAYHVRYTLEKLHLTQEMITTTDCLNHFSMLTCLYIDKNIIKNLHELDCLLRHFPHLKEIAVDFYDIHSTDQNNKENLHGIYPNIKNLSFYNFTPQTDDQLNIFTQNFTRLQSLYIAGRENKTWPGIDVNPHATTVFFKTLESLLEYKVTVPGNVTRVGFNSKQVTLANNLSIMFFHKILHHNILTDDDGSSTIEKTRFDPNHQMLLNYRVVDNVLVGRQVLSNLNENIQRIEINGASLYAVAVYLNALLTREYRQLKSIVLSNLVLRHYSIPEDITPTRQHIQNLEFYNCRTCIRTLSLLSTHFTELKYVYFNNCMFPVRPKNDIYSLYISMSSTDIDTMCVSDNEENIIPIRTNVLTKPYAIITIACTDRDLKRYYATLDDSIVVETTDIDFKSQQEKYEESQALAIIHLRVNSVKRFLLKLHDVKGKYIQIDL